MGKSKQLGGDGTGAVGRGDERSGLRPRAQRVFPAPQPRRARSARDADATIPVRVGTGAGDGASEAEGVPLAKMDWDESDVATWQYRTEAGGIAPVLAQRAQALAAVQAQVRPPVGSPARRARTADVADSSPPAAPGATGPASGRGALYTGAGLVLGLLVGVLLGAVALRLLLPSAFRAAVVLPALPGDAQLWVDGELYGHPEGHQVLHLSADTAHHLRVVRPGYRPWWTQLRLRAGETLQLPPVVLLPLANAQPDTGTGAAASTTSPRPRSSPASPGSPAVP